MVGCAVSSCRKKQFKGSGIHFFSFPSDPHQKRLWIELINRKNFEPTVHSRVCSLHFEDSCFETDPAVLKSIEWKLERPKIKPFAVPSIGLTGEKKKRRSRILRKKNDEQEKTRPVSVQSGVSKAKLSNVNGITKSFKSRKKCKCKENRNKKKSFCEVSNHKKFNFYFTLHY